MKPAVRFSPVLLIMIILLPVAGSSQNTNPGSAQKDSVQKVNEDSVYESVDIEASFPGGDDAWKKFLEQNVNGGVTADYGAPAGSYTVVIQFTVDTKRKISDIKPLTHHGYGIEPEVIRILRKSPPWNPASQHGRLVKAFRKQPVTFTVIVGKKRGRKNKD